MIAIEITGLNGRPPAQIASPSSLGLLSLTSLPTSLSPIPILEVAGLSSSSSPSPCPSSFLGVIAISHSSPSPIPSSRVKRFEKPLSPRIPTPSDWP